MHRLLFYYPAGQKFTQNRSISYGFRDIHTFSFSTKIQDGRQKWRKLNFFPLHKILLYYPAGQKFARNCSISYGFRDIHTFFYFPLKSKMAAKSAEFEIFPLCIGYSCTTLRVKNSLEIALSRTVFKILTLFHFSQKSKMSDKSGENGNFSPLHRILLYYPGGQKFSRNRSTSCGFQDIHTFSFSTKIQDGRQKWRKLKFFLFA